MTADESGSATGNGGLFPIPERRVKQAFYLAVFAWVGFLMVNILSLDRTSRLVPLLVGVPTLALVVLSLLPVDLDAVVDRIVPVSVEPEEETVDVFGRLDENRGYDPGKEQRVALSIIGWCIALVVVVYLFGYYYGLPPYIFAFTWYLYGDVRKAAVVTVLFVVAVTILFIFLFNVILFSGVLGLPNPAFYL